MLQLWEVNAAPSLFCTVPSHALLASHPVQWLQPASMALDFLASYFSPLPSNENRVPGSPQLSSAVPAVLLSLRGFFPLPFSTSIN